MATQTKNPAKKAAETPKAAKRGRGSEPEMDFSALVPKEESEPLKVQRQRQANPFLDHINKSVEAGKAFSFDNLPNERAANQVVSLLSRGAEILNRGMSTRKIPLSGGRFKVTWQAKAERTKRPRSKEAAETASSQS